MAQSRLLVHGSLAACAAMWGLVYVAIHESLPIMPPVSLGGSWLPYLSWYRSLRTLPANSGAAHMCAVPLFAMVLAWLILHNRAGEVAWIGAAFVLVGMAFTQARGMRRREKVAQHAVANPGGPAPIELEEA